MDRPNHIVKFPCNHQLAYIDLQDTGEIPFDSFPHKCDGCGSANGCGYYCSVCGFGAHVECIDFPEIINHPCHSRHPLKKISPPEAIDYADGKCHLCASPFDDLMYHCSICNFSIDLNCARVPPPLTIYQPKNHDHTFTLMASKVSFTCHACEMDGDRNPYVCLECGFLLHKDCVNLPRVININRHEHRISHSYHPHHGDWECGVCRKKIVWALGAFSCKLCPVYAVHSKCAIREDVWDGKELEDEPEEEEIEDPYKVINEKEIIHFSHEHNLRLGEDNVSHYQKMRCDACVSPINSDPFFRCVQCEFFLLHKVCASLPRKKRNIMHNHKLVLNVDSKVRESCTYCRQYFDGFGYNCEISYRCSAYHHFVLDVRCASISEPFHHELHPHPLYRTSTKHKTCGACGKKAEYVLSGIVCEFALSMECATLPRKVKHRCDDHDLSLHHGTGNSKGLLWCDICEGKTDPSVWYYGCDDCGTTLHIKCVLGDMYCLKPGNSYKGDELLLNNGMSRPFCFICKNRCMSPSFLKGILNSDSTVIYACSLKCAGEYEWCWKVKYGHLG